MYFISNVPLLRNRFSGKKRVQHPPLFPYIRAASTSIMHTNAMSNKLWLPPLFPFIRHQPAIMFVHCTRTNMIFSICYRNISFHPSLSKKSQSQKIFFVPCPHPPDKPTGKGYRQCNATKPVTFITLCLFTYPICCSIFTE